MADNTWEPMEQVFAPTKVQAYHQAHPIEQPWPHKRTRGTSIKLISSCSPCQTPLHPQVQRLLSLPVPSSPRSQKSTKMPLNPRLPHMYHLRSRSKRIKTCPSDPSIPKPAPSVQSLPSQPYQSSGRMQQGRHKSKSKRSPDRLPPPSKGENKNFEPASNSSEKGMSGHGQISIGSEQRCISEITELPLACRALSQMVLALSTSESLSADDPPKPVTSADPPKTLQLLKEPWEGPAMTSTITSSMLARTCPPGMSALPQRVRYLVGSEPCSTQLILDFEPSLPEPKTSMIGGLQPTFSDTAARQSKSVPSQTL